MYKQMVGAITAIMLISGCSGLNYVQPESSNKPCIKNFKVQGSMLSGQTFLTWSTIQGLDRRRTLPQIATLLESDDFEVIQVDQSKGLIRALHKPTMAAGRERAAVLDASIKTQQGKSTISLSFRTNAGQFVSDGDVQSTFCKMLEATIVEGAGY